jgi:arginase family enzyme
MFAHAQGEYNKSKWIIIGIPSEIGSLSHVKNYIEGPESIRDASYRIFSPIFGEINMEDIYDYGDIDLEDINYMKRYIKKLKKYIGKIKNTYF